MAGSGDRRRDRDDHRSYEEENRHRRSSYERRDRDGYRSSENERDRHRHGARNDYEEEDRRRDRDEDRRRDEVRQGRHNEEDRRRDRDEVRQGRNNNEDRRKDRDEVRQGPEEGREPELYAICRGRVHSIKPFGIFVRLDEYRSQGLVHISQVSSYEVSKRDDPDEAKVQAMSAIYGIGEAVWVKIISVKRDGGSVKIGCSLKHVAQSDGRDMDPSNLQLQLQESRPERQERQKTSLGAVYDVVCPRCGGHGHLKNECYSTGDKVYELVPEEDEDPDKLVPQPRAVVAASSEAQVHGRRERLPDNVSTVEEAKELIALLKAEKKEKKRLRKEEKKQKKSKKSRS